MKIRSSIASVVLALAALGASAANPRAQEPSQDGGFDPDQYPVVAVAALVKQNPCRSGEVRDIPFSAQLTYAGAVRDIPDKDREMVRRWAKAVDAVGQAGNFSREILLRDGKASWWMPTPRSLLDPIQQDLGSGDTATFYMSYMGCVDGSPVIEIEEYAAPDYEDLEEDAASYVA